MIDDRPTGRRGFLTLALFSPLALLGCGGSPDGSQVQIGEATKAEVKTRAELYRSKAALKKSQNAPKR